MTEELTEYDVFFNRLRSRFPEMYARNSSMPCVGVGWFPIVEELSEKIHEYTIANGLEPIVIQQIKEKFGGFRFYYMGGDENIDLMVREAEAKARVTCEECGQPGETRDLSWIRTLCEQHYQETLEEIKSRGY